MFTRQLVLATSDLKRMKGLRLGRRPEVWFPFVRLALERVDLTGAIAKKEVVRMWDDVEMGG